MPRNGSGTYSAPANSWNPAVDGTTIDSGDWNAQLADYVDAFTDSLSRTGDGGMQADLSVSTNSVVLSEIVSPANPSANDLKLYALDVTGTTRLAYKDSAGSETILDGAATPAGSDTQVQFNNSGALGASANLTWSSPALTVGVAGSATGQLKLTGSSSGTITVQGQAAAGTFNFNLPTTAGTSGQALLSAAGGASPMTWGSVLKPGTTATVTVGYTVTPNNLGNITSFTVDPALGNYQYGTNHGAATWTAPASDCAVDILVTNDGSAGAITFSGFTVGSSTGSALTTTNTNKFLISIRRINSVATYSIYALQ